MSSPYTNKPEAEWSDITRSLIANHPLKPSDILNAAEKSWARLWSTTVGDLELGFPLADADPPATVVGYFFEKLFTKELSQNFPAIWRGGAESEKDLHCITDAALSVEIKTSGQCGYKVYGNRSYGQTVENPQMAKKDNSGYYITINFYNQTLTLLRFGWIDAGDWQPQKSPTGQMAGLKDSVYKHKLLTIPGSYILNGPVELIDGVGDVVAAGLRAVGVLTIGQLIEVDNIPERYRKLQKKARDKFYSSR